MFRFLVWLVGVAALIVILLRITILNAWTIPNDPELGASMAPTLKAGDTVLVTTRGTPGIGDLVRCPDPDNPGLFVVGRIMGTGNDEVELRRGGLRVNGTRYDASDACEVPSTEVMSPEGQPVEIHCARVRLAGGWFFRGTNPKAPNGSVLKWKVPSRHVFLLSDNVDMGLDSRDFGALPADSCIEKIVFRMWGAKGWADADARLTAIH